MDIQSAELNKLFVLFPVIIPGWVTPVKPDGIAHGGIPNALYDGQARGLEFLVEPLIELLGSWTMAADDRVDLYCNGNLVPGAGQTVKPGEEQLRQRLYLPHGYLMQGVNTLHYVVTRVSGNSEPSRDLLVLYHLRPADSLNLVIPADVINDGVSAARAAQGVAFGFTYANRRKYDRIEFLLGDTQVRFDVPDGTAPITHTLFTKTFREAGDNPSAVAEFHVIDQLGNRVKSPEKRLDIHLDRIKLQTPILLTPARTPIDVLAYTDGVTVQIEHQTAELNDQALLIIENPGVDDKPFPARPFNQNKRANFKLNPALLLSWMGREVNLSWQLIRNGQPVGKSLPLVLTINKIANGDARLKVGVIDQADSARIVDTNEFKGDATVSHKNWPLRGGVYSIDINITGTDTNGNAFVISIVKRGSLTPAEEQNGFSRTLPRAKLLLLKDSSNLDIKTEVHFKGTTPWTLKFPASLIYIIQNKPPILSENFDSEHSRFISSGGSISIPSMKIHHLGGEGLLGINSINTILTGPYPPIHNQSSAQVLEMHTNILGHGQHMRLEFRWGYSSVGFYYRFVQTNGILVRFLDKSGRSLSDQHLVNNPGPLPVFFSTSTNSIWFIDIITSVYDLITFDYFTMGRTK